MAKTDKKAATARSAAVEVLQQVLGEGAYTNIAVNKYLRSHELSDMDRRLMTELVYGTVKAVGTIDWYLQQCVTRPLNKIDKLVLNVLRVSVYQLLYMDKIPASAACNEAVNLARLFSHEGTAKFVNGVLRGLLRKKDSFTFPDAEKETADYISLAMYHPRWLVKKWLKNYGRAETEALCAFDNTPAPVCLRVNTLVTTREKLMAKLIEAGAEVRASKWSADGIVCEKLPALSTVFAGMHNEFYVQDESSMLVGAVLAPKAGETVIDMCSAPGGKTTHLAQLMQNEGIIYAGDVHEHKIKLIEENATRLGITNIKAQIQDATEFVEAWDGKADKVLVDAPCSGMGVLRRRAEARWRKTRNDLKIFPPLQLKILTNAARYVKAGGTLVYSTCTIEQAENHYLVQEFLATHPDWRIEPFAHPLTGEMVEELQLLPQKDNVDGFYICKLVKK